LECPGDGEEEERHEGVTFKPIPGNAVFWENLREDGSAYWETWHAGLPVETGEKIGLNVWSWLQEGYEPVRVPEGDAGAEKDVKGDEEMEEKIEGKEKVRGSEESV
jgi:prolyl 4-hydroxylase